MKNIACIQCQIAARRKIHQANVFALQMVLVSTPGVVCRTKANHSRVSRVGLQVILGWLPCCLHHMLHSSD